MQKSICIWFLWLFIPLTIVAQEFKATVNKDVVAVGDHFKITFKLNDKGSNFQAPNFSSNFRILSGPNHSSSMQIINGNFSVSESYSFILMPLKEGTFTIPPAKITVNGEVIESNPITIEVVKGSAPPPSSAQNNQSQKNQSNQSSISNTEDVFIKCYVSKSNPYVGEHLVVTFKIYNRLNIVDNNVTEMPSFNGFWSEEIDIQPTTQYEIVNGKRYQTAILKKMVLFPQRSGKITIDPLEMELVARVPERRRGNSFFDQFFGTYVDKKLKVRSNPVTVNVKPLPSPVPANFSGAVGSFSIQMHINKNELTVNDAINLKFKIKGNGNLKLIEAPKIEFPSDFEVYDPKIIDKTAVTSGGVSGSKTFDYLIIPRYPGDFVIKPIEFVYFDLSKKQFVTLTTDSLKIKVLPGNGGNTSVSTYIPENKKDIRFLSKDIRFIKTDKTHLKRKDDFLITSPLFWTLYLLPVLLSMLFIPVYQKLEKYYSNTALLRQKRAGKIASHHLKKAKKLLSENKTDEFKEELSKALFDYVNRKLQISQAELTIDFVKSKLEEKQVPQEITNEFVKILNDIEMARFAPSAALADNELLANAEKVINELEKHLS
ncbi:MAG: protein BatD [Bacteroidetes bacterium]|nr:MAG: protein BatD [Bacteroidota bacterium]